MFKFFQKSRIAYVAMSVVLFAVGLCLIIWPAMFAKIFCYLLCLMLNLMSAFIPTWRAMRRPIVTSLYEKR